MEGANAKRVLKGKTRKNSVLFSPYRSKNLEFQGRSLPVKDEHISVWLNDANANVHLHHVYDLIDDHIRVVDRVFLIDVSSGEFGVALYTTSFVTTLDGSPVNTRVKPASSTELPAFEAEESTLIVTYCFASSSERLPDLSFLGIGMKALEFERVQAACYYTYLSIPAYDRGRSTHLSTSFVRVNEEKIGTHVAPVTAWSIAALASMIEMQMRHVKDTQEATIKDEMTRAGIQMRPGDLPSHNSVAPLSTLRAQGNATFYTLDGQYAWQVD